jgi:hypothetical protein
MQPDEAVGDFLSLPFFFQSCSPFLSYILLYTGRCFPKLQLGDICRTLEDVEDAAKPGGPLAEGGVAALSVAQRFSLAHRDDILEPCPEADIRQMEEVVCAALANVSGGHALAPYLFCVHGLCRHWTFQGVYLQCLGHCISKAPQLRAGYITLSFRSYQTL